MTKKSDSKNLSVINKTDNVRSEIDSVESEGNFCLIFESINDHAVLTIDNQIDIRS